MSQTAMTEEGLVAAFDDQSEEIWLIFLELNHQAITGGPLRFVRNTENVTRGGQLYTGLMFDITLPGQHDRQAASASLSLPNVDRRITDVLRPISGHGEPVSVELSVALASSPDETQHGPWLTGLRSVTWNAQNVQGELVPVVDMDQSWPSQRMDNAGFPGLFPG